MNDSYFNYTRLLTCFKGFTQMVESSANGSIHEVLLSKVELSAYIYRPVS